MPITADEPSIELRDVSFGYGDTFVIEHVTFSVKQGEYLGIIGPNGGGKTTLLKLMMGLLEPTDGQVFLFGELVRRSTHRSRIGYVPQKPIMDALFPASVEEIVMSGRTALRGMFHGFTAEDKAAAAKALETAGIAHLASRKIGSLSGGERQRALIARALAGEPEILFLDEPTSAVDVPAQEAFYAFLADLHAKSHLSIVMVSHDVDMVAHEVKSVVCLNRHVTCHGPTENVFRAGNIDLAFGKAPEIKHEHP